MNCPLGLCAGRRNIAMNDELPAEEITAKNSNSFMGCLDGLSKRDVYRISGTGSYSLGDVGTESGMQILTMDPGP